MRDARPDPDALLAKAQSESTAPNRGRLKVFFGASAGVGKTYAMLQEARERKAGGMEVVVGYVEAHKRPETLALLEGLEAIEPREIAYRGIKLREFDLDAGLKRRPELLLVDELAHTNAEGLRHAKRWQDVVELLDAGIDVYTTVNVQHIESLNDIVAKITGVVVRETVPDSIIERADEIELVDLPPDDLLQRLRDGKVYLPTQVEHAVEKFFRKEVLVALRELALRQTAQRVGEQVQVERAGRAINESWPTAERLLVCIGPSPLSARVIRTARRMAASLHCEWFGAVVETPRTSATTRERSRRNLRLAERLGAETLTLNGESIPDEIIAFARSRNVSKIVIGKPSLPRWREWLRGSIVEDIIRQSGEIDVHVVKGEPDEEPSRESESGAQRTDWRPYVWMALVMAACTAIAWVMFPVLSAVNLTMIYLAGVVFVATRFGPGPSAAAAFIAPLVFNFFFTEPYYSFRINDAQYIVSFVALLATALVVSGLTQRVRRQAQAVRTRYLRTIALYFMSRMLAGAADRRAVLNTVARHMKDVFGGDVVVLTPKNGSLSLQDVAPDSFIRDGNEITAAQWVFHNQKWAGRGTDTLPGCRGFYVPLITSGRPLGVLGLFLPLGSEGLEPDQRHLLETFATQSAIALERAEFAEQAEQARIRAEAEQTRSALLSSVSHDLRTPLAMITGSASTLLQDDDKLTASARLDLLQSIHDEGSRLNQFVGKLLDMTRLESAGMHVARDWFPLDEIVGSALNRLDRNLRDHDVQTDLPSDLPLVFIDGVLIEEVLVNLIENAARYTPPHSMIRISARSSVEGVRVEVLDNGPGLKPGAEATVFEKFFRDRPRTDRSGTGLGLAISRAIVHLHGGQIGVTKNPASGACFWFTIPDAALPAPSERAKLAQESSP